jgi:hypothetical protein
MRLWGGLIFRNQLSFGSSPSGGAARFPSLKTVRTVTSPAMPTLPDCVYDSKVLVTDCLLKHELQKSLHPSPVVSRLLHRPV